MAEICAEVGEVEEDVGEVGDVSAGGRASSPAKYRCTGASRRQG